MKKKKKRKLKQKKREQEKLEKRNTIPEGAILANLPPLIPYNTHGQLPEYYMDKEFICRDCGSNELWTATQQKWWYEVAKGSIYSNAVRCRSCREKVKEAKERQKKHMEEMALKKPHPNEAFFKKVKR